MDNVKDDAYYLDKIINDIEFMIEHTKGKTKEDIEKDPLLLDSVMFRFIQIAENNEKLSTEFKMRYKDIPWKAIKGMRNKIVHDYGVVDVSIIYDTITVSVPDLYGKLKKIL
ncbi:MAG: DUF86 domain-containing protein [Clostridia bacterium]|nr:DUF86 domain-containing protein [Clostridia bacterium]